MSENKKRLHISIAFGDAILPVIDCEDGFQRVPLKPIADQIGINYSSQRERLKKSDYLIKRLGLILIPVKGYQVGDLDGGKPQFCIRVDRVTSFLNSLNVSNIRAMGNHSSADWLETKHEEWDDALHQYETNGVAVKPESRSSVIDVLAKIDRIKNPELKRIAAVRANEVFGLDIKVANQTAMDLS